MRLLPDIVLLLFTGRASAQISLDGGDLTPDDSTRTPTAIDVDLADGAVMIKPHPWWAHFLFRWLLRKRYV